MELRRQLGSTDVGNDYKSKSRNIDAEAALMDCRYLIMRTGGEGKFATLKRIPSEEEAMR
jgi:hypothetical protein